ncbi:unnamed protein product [Peniophora sp. CBMAI 1063]|nr:unnamed protein product [Peniophora sp. CBMAI 1063]
MGDVVIGAVREHNALAPIHVKLAVEQILEIFLALSEIDIPTPSSPQGWYLRVKSVCRRWRSIATSSPELWARCAGSFLSRNMTDLAIQRAGLNTLLSLDGHIENTGSECVLTEYQLSLIETQLERLCSFVHEKYRDWSSLFYRLKTFPKLQSARIWDDSGPEMWSWRINAPLLQSLYMNNALIPFDAPKLRYLRVDMDDVNWRQPQYTPESDDSDSPMSDGCELAIPRIFPTSDFVAFLQRSPCLERLVVTNMPPLITKGLPTASELHARLPHLRGLHLGGKSQAMGDFWQRLDVPPDVQVFIDTDYPRGDNLDPEMSEKVMDHLNSPMHDSLRLSLTPSYDMLIQMWSSEAHNAFGLDLPASLELMSGSAGGPAFTLRVPSEKLDVLESFLTQQEDLLDLDPVEQTADDLSLKFRRDVTMRFHMRASQLIRHMRSPTLRCIDFTDLPLIDPVIVSPQLTAWTIPMKFDDYLWELYRGRTRMGVILDWSFFQSALERNRARDFIPRNVWEVTIVNFPCAAFPSRARYDEDFNAKAWDKLYRMFFHTHWDPQGYEHRWHHYDHLMTLKLAESRTEMSNMKRSEEPEYRHTFQGSYEDAVRAVTEQGYQRVAPYVAGFEDLRVHSWPYY